MAYALQSKSQFSNLTQHPTVFSHSSNGLDDMNCIVEPTEELGGIYLGNIKAARDPEFLRRNKIRAVLTVASRTGIIYQENLIHFHKVIEAEDIPSFELGTYWDQTFEFIDTNRKYTSVYIHCYAGISRSVATTIAYLMKKHGVTAQEGLSFVKAKRKQASPNFGFINQLSKYENYLKTGVYGTPVNNGYQVPLSNMLPQQYSEYAKTIPQGNFVNKGGKGQVNAPQPIINITNNNNYNMNFDDPRIVKNYGMASMR